MNTYRSVRFNFLMNFILTVSNFIFPLITFPYVSRVLGASGVGTVSFATSIVTYFSMVGMLGIPTYGIRACAKVRQDQDKLNQTVQEIFVLNSLAMGISILFFAATVFWVPQLASEKHLYLILSSTLVFNVLGVEWLYKALEKYAYITGRSLFFKLFSLVLLLVAVRSPEDYVLYGAISVFAAVGSNALNFLHLRRIIPLRPLKHLNIKQHLRPTLTFFLLNVSTTIYNNVDTTMVGFIRGTVEVGYYTAAVKVQQILVSVVTSLGAVLLPRLSFYHEEGHAEAFQQLVQKSLDFVILLASPMVVYFIILAEPSILFLSGSDFLPAVLPMQLILICVLFIGLSNLMGIQILVPTNRERLVVISTALGALSNILVNALAIPFFGAAGAAFATAVAEAIVALVQLYFLRDLIVPMLQQFKFWRLLLALGLASLASGLVMGLLMAGSFVTLLVTAIVFFAIYGLILLFLGEPFVRENLALILSKLSHRSNNS